jgi:hypothetical protein
LITRLFLSALIILIGSTNAWGARPNAIGVTCDFMEKYQDSVWQVVDSRSFLAPLSEDFQFSMGNFAYRLRADTVGGKAVQLQSMVNCLDTKPRNYLDQKIVQRGASLFFDSVLVRGESYYRIRLTFDSLGHIADDCGYRFADSSFVSDPSGKYDFYYIKQSLGDYRWNQIRDAFEFDYKKIAPIFNLSDQAKIYYYISPCEIRDVGWDHRWDNAIDLSRNNVFAHYSPSANRLYMPAVMSLRFLRNWGYAPALLLEGVASAPEFCDLYAKDDRKNGKLPELSTLGISRKYRALDRTTTSMAAGSFATYLLRTRGLGKLRDWYQQSTDLTVPQMFQQVYGQSLAAIETEWHGYLDTVSISASLYNYYIAHAQAFMHTDDMMLFAKAALAATADTSYFGASLANLYYTYGDYSQAARFFRYMIADDSTDAKAKATARVFLANMLLADGKVAIADSLYSAAAQADSTDSYVYLKLAQIELTRGRLARSVDLYKQAAAKNKLPANGIDVDIALGDAHVAAGQVDSAGSRYQAALNHAKVMISSSGAGDNPLHYLRAGKAAVRLGSAKVALDYLNLAFFLEERMFYLGQIFLALGQTHDLLGDRKTALENYRKVLKYPTAYSDRQEAEKYLQKAYHN